MTTGALGICLEILEATYTPITAIEIAERLHLYGTRETKRRHVRALIERLRVEHGKWIIATLQQGYWLTDDAAIWRDYQEGRMIDAKRCIGRARKAQVETERSGQRVLFDGVLAAKGD